MDLDYGTQKVYFQSKNLLIPHYRPMYCSSAFLSIRGFNASEGGVSDLRMIKRDDFVHPSSSNPCPPKHEKSTIAWCALNVFKILDIRLYIDFWEKKSHWSYEKKSRWRVNYERQREGYPQSIFSLCLSPIYCTHHLLLLFIFK